MTRSTFSILMACACHLPAAVSDVCPDFSQHPADGHSDLLGNPATAVQNAEQASPTRLRSSRVIRTPSAFNDSASLCSARLRSSDQPLGLTGD
jgi:hypothetical protein